MTRPAPDRRGASLLVAFAALGVVSASVPAAIPGAAVRMGVRSEELLPGVSALFLGLFAGVVVAAMRRPGRPHLVAGLCLQAVGLVLVGLSGSPAVFFAACVVAGVGFGLVEAGATALTRLHLADGTPARLALLNGAAAVSAGASPLLLAAASPAGEPVALAVLGVVPMGGAVVSWGAWRAAGAAPSPVASRLRAPFRWRGLAVAAAALFVFVGAETVLSGWSSVLPQSVLGAPAGAAAIGTTVFWTLMAAGRFACAAVLRRGVSPVVCLIVALLAAAAAAVGAAVLREGVAAVILAGVAVLLVAPGYALLLGVALARVGSEAAIARATAALVAVGSAGGVVVSFAVALGAGAAPVAVLLSVAGLLAGCAVLVAAAARLSPGGPDTAG